MDISDQFCFLKEASSVGSCILFSHLLDFFFQPPLFIKQFFHGLGDFLYRYIEQLS